MRKPKKISYEWLAVHQAWDRFLQHEVDRLREIISIYTRLGSLFPAFSKPIEHKSKKLLLLKKEHVSFLLATGDRLHELLLTAVLPTNSLIYKDARWVDLRYYTEKVHWTPTQYRWKSQEGTLSRRYWTNFSTHCSNPQAPNIYPTLTALFSYNIASHIGLRLFTSLMKLIVIDPVRGLLLLLPLVNADI